MGNTIIFFMSSEKKKKKFHRFCFWQDQNAFQKILRKNNSDIFLENISSRKKIIEFFRLLESSETYDYPSSNEIGAKLIFWSLFFCINFEYIFFKRKKNGKIVSAYVSGHCTYFGAKNWNLATLGCWGTGGGLHVVL